MSKFEDGSYQCLPGPALIAKVLAGRCKMNYTRAAVGQGAIAEGISPKTLTEPPGYVMDAMIAAVTNPVNGECQITVQINSSRVEHGFYCTGIMIYAEDPDEGQVPYTYLRLEDGPEWIRPSTSIVGKLATFDLIAAVGTVDAVSANIDPEAMVTRAVVEQLITESTDGIMERVEELVAGASCAFILGLTIPAQDWEANGEEGAGVYLDIPHEAIRADMVPLLTILPLHGGTALECGLCSVAQTLDGGLRVYAECAPEAEMEASLTLVCPSGSVPGGAAAGYVLPPATAARLGGVKIGDGVDVEEDGTIHVDGAEVLERAAASEESAAQVLDGVFGPGKK